MRPKINPVFKPFSPNPNFTPLLITTDIPTSVKFIACSALGEVCASRAIPTLVTPPHTSIPEWIFHFSYPVYTLNYSNWSESPWQNPETGRWEAMVKGGVWWSFNSRPKLLILKNGDAWGFQADWSEGHVIPYRNFRDSLSRFPRPLP